MGLYTYITKTFNKEYSKKSPEYKLRLREWRKANVVTEVEKPTNISRARNLGYKAKEGYFIVRVKVGRGLRARPKPTGGRKPRHNYKYKAPGVSYQVLAEQKAGKKYPGLEVLNSYWVGEDGQHKYFEVILIDPLLAGVKLQRGRAFRGLTSSGRKSRGIRHKGKKKRKPPR
ncbi:50S ribosomal protein L15e [Candidatus Micrarchaeota archaeon]|nr:50S ribosomal protein L15e [Candidatus Micrarchaeota archaeon]